MLRSGRSKAVKNPALSSAASSLSKSMNSKSKDTTNFMKMMNDPDIIERVRVTIKNAHVFKLPPRQTVSVGWRGADWKEKVWQGTVRVVERGDMTAVLLVDKISGDVFAVCPVREGSVDRCIDSSRYFVLRIENVTGRHMFIGVAFNERNDAFDFNTALEDSRREREAELAPPPMIAGPTKDYSIKEGEKIRVSIPKVSTTDRKDLSPTGTEAFENFFSTSTNNGSPDSSEKKASAAERRRAARGKGPKSSSGGGLLAPSNRDTPSRIGQISASK